MNVFYRYRLTEGFKLIRHIDDTEDVLDDVESVL